MTEAFSAERLAQLAERWEREPSSRVFLQLAEEYRRGGQLGRAAEVLEQGLERQPTYVAALVLLGRCRLEAGSAAAAVTAFEKALAQDVAQLVANKLLIEAYLRTGHAGRAKERLDFYRLFNDRDAEIEDLERRIAAAGRSTAPASPLAPAPAAPAASAAPAAPATAAPSPRTSHEMRLFDLGRPAVLPPLELAAPARTRHGSEEPFGALHDSAGARGRIVAALAAQGVFEVTLAGPAPRAVPDSPRYEPPATPQLAAPPTAIAQISEVESLFEPEPGAVEQPPWGSAARGTELEMEPREHILAAPFSPRSIGEEVERETIEEPFDEVLAAGSPAVTMPRSIPSPDEDRDFAAPASEVEPEPTEPEGIDLVSAQAVELLTAESELDETAFAPPSVPEPSSTLGELYLSQGYLDEAEREFRSVLDRKPLDAAARAGLEQIDRRRAPVEDTASGWRAGSATPRPQGGLTQRKVATLREFLGRIRRDEGSARVS